MSNRCRNPLRRDRRGVSTLEFALVLPVLLLLCFAIVAYCLFFFTEESLRISTAYEARAYAITVETVGTASTCPTTLPFPTILSTTAMTLSCKNSSVTDSSGTKTTTVKVTSSYPFGLAIPFIPYQHGKLSETTSITFIPQS